LFRLAADRMKKNNNSQPPVLLVEDDLSLRKSLEQFLADHGYRTLCVSTISSAFEAFRVGNPWLCLLDLNLPDGSGLELLRFSATRELPCRFIVMTAFNLTHQKPGGCEASLAGWMTKPVNPDQLLKLVESEQQRQLENIA
jgi:two-component system, NtrC family, response regulator HydG